MADGLRHPGRRRHGLLGWVARYGWRVTRRTMRFLDEWRWRARARGPRRHARRHGPAQGVENLVASINAELHPNGGDSLRDVVSLTAAHVAEIRTEQAAVRTRLEAFDAKRAEQEKA